MVPYKRKKTKGRQKVEMKLMQNQSNRHVTFSKRRSGVFKKANELAVMCGAESAVIIFTPGEKVHCYGHPSVNTIVDRYMQGNHSTSGTAITEVPQGNENVEGRGNPSTSSTAIITMSQGNETVEELNELLSQLEIALEDEREKGRVLNLNQLKRKKQLWEAPTGELDREQLEKLIKEIEDLKFNVDIHKNVIQVAGEGTSSEAAPSVLGHDPSMAYSGASLTAPVLPGLGHEEAINNGVGPSELGHDASIAHSGASFSLPTAVGLGHESSFTYAAGPSRLGHNASAAYSGASFFVPTSVGLSHETSSSNAAGSSGFGHDAYMPYFGASSSVSGPVGLGSEASFSYAAGSSGFDHHAFTPPFGALSLVPAPLGPRPQASFPFAAGLSGLGYYTSMPYSNALLSIPSSFGFGRGAPITYNAGPSWLGHNAFMAYSGIPFSVSSQVALGQESLGNYNAGVSFGGIGSITTSQIGPSGFVNGSSLTYTVAPFSDSIVISGSSLGESNQATLAVQYGGPLADAGETDEVEDGSDPDGSAPKPVAQQAQRASPS